MELLTTAIFALALNIDALGAGVAYGIRKIKIPFSSLLIISLMSVLAIIISMTFGHVVAGYLSEALATRIGGIMLMCIGVWILIQSWPKSKGKKTKNMLETNDPTVMQIRIRSLGLVIQILRDPSMADLDKSGVISPQEALLLGTALAMDAFAAGFAVSMMGFNLLLTGIVVGVGHIVMTYGGLLMGSGISTSAIGHRIAVLPGFLLIALGLSQMY
ncbi:sporulation membrane protein YtaF [Desulfofalx alkaliphila]|uniref:sporulation membrane protein YtaF n=1 Tax=Desulfofalx alkaliphila TaxID=105483 RepID=UPI0004E240FF|nr:sporulation membrane protein YtaF [Desulfofalx alkaliphila]